MFLGTKGTLLRGSLRRGTASGVGGRMLVSCVTVECEERAYLWDQVKRTA